MRLVGKLRVLSLFSGIGGIDLGLERAGMRIVGQVEIEEFPIKVLEKHWPKVARFRDIRTVSADDIRRRCGRIDVIAGGFPCQDISTAGKGAGIDDGERSGLWREMRRLIAAVRPAWVLIENVPALKVRGADGVLAALESLGYACWPSVVGVWAVGAPHQRNRIWILAYHVRVRERGCDWQGERGLRVGDSSETPRKSEGRQSENIDLGDSHSRRQQIRSISEEERKDLSESHGAGKRVANTDSKPRRSSTDKRGRSVVEAIEIVKESESGEAWNISGSSGVELVDASGPRCPRGGVSSRYEKEKSKLTDPSNVPHPNRNGLRIESGRRCGTCGQDSPFPWPASPGGHQQDWEEPRTVEPELGRAINGLSGRLDKHRLKGLGNAVVPQIVQIFGEWIVQQHKKECLPD